MLPSLAFETEVHKCRIKQQTQHIEQLESKVEHYVEQQSLMALMREDLGKYKAAYNKSLKEATMFALFTPTTQY
jgi:hypothetical protein